MQDLIHPEYSKQMKLRELAELIVGAKIQGDPETIVQRIQADSRQLKRGDLFLCLRGHTVDGHDFIDEALRKGASALVTERSVAADVPQIIVKNSREAMAVFADHAYGYPSHEMKVIGITGTNGKTTTSYLIDKILSDRGHRTGLMGTIQMKIGDRLYEVKNTTPDALDLQRNFRAMRAAAADYCVMEVSSHALAMGRVKGVRFRTAVFTNLTQDHLDYHKTMEAYRDAKTLLFSRLGNTYAAAADERRFAVINRDDPAAEAMIAASAAHVVTYGLDAAADVRASDIQVHAGGTRFVVQSFAGDAEVSLQLVGKFSVYNALAALAAALCEGVPLHEAARSLEQVTGVAGRFEPVHEGQPFLVIVDYSHTPDSLENVLATISEFAEGHIYCVFGCGGDRDRTKRPIMGRIAAAYSDYVIVTSDNPRSEDPERILLDIETGISQEGLPQHRYEKIVDRRQAIQKAVAMARPGDVVLIAGKGHETYQEIGGTRIEFDDRLVAKAAIRSRMS